MFLSTENRSGLKYSVKNSHHHLFVKLWALSQNSRFMEIAEFKQVRASLSTSGSDLRRMDLRKSIFIEIITKSPCQSFLDFKSCALLNIAEGKGTVI